MGFFICPFFGFCASPEPEIFTGAMKASVKIIDHNLVDFGARAANHMEHVVATDMRRFRYHD